MQARSERLSTPHLRIWLLRLATSPSRAFCMFASSRRKRGGKRSGLLVGSCQGTAMTAKQLSTQWKGALPWNLVTFQPPLSGDMLALILLAVAATESRWTARGGPMPAYYAGIVSDMESLHATRKLSKLGNP